MSKTLNKIEKWFNKKWGWFFTNGRKQFKMIDLKRNAYLDYGTPYFTMNLVVGKQLFISNHLN